MRRALLAFVLAITALVVVPAGNASAICWFFCTPPPSPSVNWSTHAADDFNRTDLGPNWITRGGGTAYLTDGGVDGTGLNQYAQSYLYWSQPAPTHVQSSSAVVRWAGRDPAHAAFGVTVRANPDLMAINGAYAPGTAGPRGAAGVTFWAVNNLMGIMYEDPSASPAFRPAVGTQAYTSTTKFPEGAVMELVVTEGTNGNDVYTAYVNGKQVMQGTVSTSIVPRTQHYVGLETSDDIGDHPPLLDNFVAKVPA